MMDGLLKIVVSKYGLQKVRETNNGMLCLCPFHENTDTPAFSMSEAGLWICFSGCGQGALPHFISRMDNIPLHIAYNQAEEFGFQREDDAVQSRKFVDRKAEKERTAQELQEHFYFLHRSYRNFSHPYLLNRGLTQTTIDAFECGYDPENLRVSLPVFSSDRILHGFQYRRVDYKDYISEPGFEKSHWLFGEQFLNGFEGWPLLIESAVDVMWLRQIGFTALGCMGKFSETQADRVCRLGYTKVIAGFDNDSSGEHMIANACEFFSGRVAVYRFDYSKMKDKDWFGVSKERMLGFYNSPILIKA
jgi:DNA primase